MATSDSSLHMNGLPIGIYAPETVGCVVVDSYGNCAAATSTGGLMNKMNGRIWDSPLIGAGSYACDICAVSCTGEGEAIIRSTLAREVGALMEYKGVGLQEAVDFVIKETLNKGGYLIGNLQPAHMDFRFFSLGNIWAIVSSLTTPKQAEGILSLMEEKWDDFVGDMPLKI